MHSLGRKLHWFGQSVNLVISAQRRASVEGKCPDDTHVQQIEMTISNHHLLGCAQRKSIPSSHLLPWADT